MADFATVREYLTQLGLKQDSIDEAEELVVVNDEESGLANLVLDCEDPLLVVEQLIVELDHDLDAADLRWLLQANRELVHGSWCLDESGRRLIYRDTLQLASLDLNELEATITALRLALAEHAGRLLAMAKGGRA